MHNLTPNRPLSFVITVFLLLGLTACGSGSGSGNGDNENKYSIGGTVSGLSGTLVLQNNSGDDITLNSDGGFTFPTAVPEGESYSVTVATHPSGQYCEVSNGTGTDSVITDLEVNCVTAHTVGGTVSGLSGTLVLQNNSGDDLTLNSDGGFTFPTAVPEGESYSVTVATQPSGQYCEVTNASGTANVVVDNVAVNCVTVHTTGGTVSGLSGTLVLQNNSGDDITLNSDGGFTFPTPVIEGGSYRVTVGTHPSGQYCEVRNGTGTANSVITDLEVNCVTAHTVGGTVSGLSGTLMLQINSGDDLTLNSDGSFTFLTAVSEGESYSVTVATHPSGQYCEVTNASGTANAVVDNVAVNCVTAYTIGGTVSGLSGMLVLQNNSGDDLTLNSDGGFTFPTAVSEGGSYSVTIATHPSGQYCEVTNGSGTANAVIADVEITCAAPSALNLQSRYGYGAPVNMVVKDNYAYSANYSGLLISDISNPADPAILSFFPTDDYAKDLAVSGNYAYVAITSSGLHVIDISDPANPTLAATLNQGYNINSITLSGNYAYLAHGSGLSIIDISDPTNPSVTGGLNIFSSRPRDIVVNGSYAYIANERLGLQIVNISDPTNPTLTATLETEYSAYGVAISGSYAYVADFTGGLHIIDISDPANPSLTTTLVTSDRTNGVAVSGNYAYVVGSSGLQIVDISDPSNPSLTATTDTATYGSSITLSMSYAYTTNGSSGLQIFDISDPANPSMIATLDTIGSMSDVAVSGSYGFFANTSNGLRIFDISDPKNPSVTATMNTTGMYPNAKGITLNSSYAYVADGSNGLQIIDISDPNNPSIAATMDTTVYAYDVVLNGSYAYVADFSGGLQIIDISDPANPSLTGTQATNDRANGVAISGNYAYVATYGYDLSIIDISDPANPSLTGTLDTSSYAVAISGNYAYVAADRNGLQVVDISDPTNPSLTTSVSTIGQARGITLSGKYAYVASYHYPSGLQIFDISSPTNPTLAAYFDTPVGNIAGIAIDSNGIYLSEDLFGLEIIETFP